MTSPSRRVSPGQGIEEVARLIEESTLGTVGARQLRDRSADVADQIRARAFFTYNSTGRAWWQANQHSPDALHAKARELATEDPEISDVLGRLADDRHAVATAGSPQAAGLQGHAPVTETAARSQAARECQENWTGFRDFHDRERPRLTAILCQQARLPASLGRKLIGRAMAEAFDDWEQLAAAGDPGEWVLGRALQLYRALRRPAALPAGEAPGASPPASTTLVAYPPPTAIQRADVHVTGALAVEVSRVEVTRPSSPSAFRCRHCAAAAQADTGDGYVTMQADGKADAVTSDCDADRVVVALFREHYRSLVLLASLLVRDVATAEEVVQDSFIALYGRWRRLRDTDKALYYLRQSVVNRSRSVLRHRAVADRNASTHPLDMPSAEHDAIVLLERSAVVAALRTMPARQREALVLRYYGDMSEAQIAAVMGISRGSVKSHTARALSALRSVLEPGP